MSILQYRTENRDRAINIPMEKIFLTAPIHQHGKYTPISKPTEDLLLIVMRNTDNSTYSLVCGWADYMEAKARNLESINCIVTAKNRAAFIRRYNDTYIQTGKIIIPECFANTTPSPEKIKTKTEYYEKHGKFKKPVKLNKNNVLMDGYINYIIPREKKIKSLPCKIVHHDREIICF